MRREKLVYIGTGIVIGILVSIVALNIMLGSGHFIVFRGS